MFEKFTKMPNDAQFAVIFSSQLSKDSDGYEELANEIFNLATIQPGFIGAEMARDVEGFGITISYWSDEDSIKNWKEVSEHRAAQHLGITRWYEHYKIRICRIERDYCGPAGVTNPS